MSESGESIRFSDISMVVDNLEKDEPVMRHRVSVPGINYPVVPPVASPACIDMNSAAENGDQDLSTSTPQTGSATPTPTIK